MTYSKQPVAAADDRCDGGYIRPIDTHLGVTCLDCKQALEGEADKQRLLCRPCAGLKGEIKPPVFEFEKNNIVKMYNDGMSITHISKKLKIYSDIVRKYLISKNVELRTNGSNGRRF